MNLAKQIAKQFREVQLNGTWISTNFKAQLEDVSLQEATTKIGTLNTIGALAFHVNYYVAGVLQVLEGGSLDIRDKYSFDYPPFETEEDWKKMVDKTCSDAEKFADLIEKMSDEQLEADFVNEKFGNYLRNLLGMTEHSYYHLGQIVLLKKLIREGK